MILKKSINDIQTKETQNFFSLSYHDDVIFNTDIKIRKYISFLADDVIISDTLNEMNKEVALTVDQDARDFYLRYGFIAPPFTLYKDIYLLAPYAGISLTKPLRFVSQFPQIDQSNIAGKDNIHQLPEDIKKSLEEFAGQYQVLFSGGIDSSFLLGLSNELDKADVAVNCHMSSMPEESLKALKMCSSKNISFRKVEIKEDLSVTARHFIELTSEPVADKIALVIPEMLEMLGNKAPAVYLDGQGADSLFCGLPHDKLFDLYNQRFYRNVGKFTGWLPVWENKKTAFGRKLYRITKVLNCLSAPCAVEMLTRSLVEDGAVKLSYDNKVQRWFNRELRSVNCYLGNFHLTIRYLFMFRVLPAREMQKYLLSESRGHTFKLPFLEENIVTKYFYTDPSVSIKENIYKYPVVFYAKRYWPGFFTGSKTSPFQVEFKTGGMSVREFSISQIYRANIKFNTKGQ